MEFLRGFFTEYFLTYEYFFGVFSSLFVTISARKIPDENSFFHYIVLTSLYVLIQYTQKIEKNETRVQTIEEILIDHNKLIKKMDTEIQLLTQILDERDIRL